MEEEDHQEPILLNEENREATEEKTSREEEDVYYYPTIRFDVPPYRTYHFGKQFRNSPNPNNFLKAVKWSPDGSCFLTSSEDNTLRKFDLPNNDDKTHEATCSSDSEDSYAANLIVNEGESVYDYCWYPYMSASDPTTCVFASTTRDHPIHLWDAITGQLRGTYRAYDAMDEITAAFSSAFNPSGTKLFAGYNKSLRIFDIHRPGRDFEQYSTLQGNKEGQSEDNMELLYVLHGQEGGVTHVQFSRDGNYLYTGGRKDPYILCWDIRNTVSIVYKLYRSSELTNQRILFDIEPSGRHLGTGGQDGQIHIYDLQTGQWVTSFQAASDTVNGFSFHPFLPMAASSSGHRRFMMPDGLGEGFSLSGEENCASVWSFFYASMAENEASIDWGDTTIETKSEDLQVDP